MKPLLRYLLPNPKDVKGELNEESKLADSEQSGGETSSPVKHASRSNH